MWCAALPCVHLYASPHSFHMLAIVHIVSWPVATYVWMPLACRLEEYLKTYKKCLVLVSHSQVRAQWWFLNAGSKFRV